MLKDELFGEGSAEKNLLRELARLTPALLFTANSRGRIDFLNERWADLLGCDVSNLLGTGWVAHIAPDDVPSIIENLNAHLLSGEPYNAQWRVRRADGTYRWIEIQAVPQRASDGTIVRWHGAGVDVDAQRRAMDALELLAESGATVATAQDVHTILERMAQASLAGLADVSFVDLHREDGEPERLVVASPNVSAEVVAAIEAFPMPKPDAAHPIARAMVGGHTVHISNVDEAYLQKTIDDPARREAWRKVGIRALITAPLNVSGRSIGALTLLRTQTPVPFDAADVRVVEEIGRRAAVAIENIRLSDRARRETQRREAEFRQIADSIPQLMWTATADGNRDWVNQRWADYTGQTFEEALGTGWQAVHHPDDLAETLRLFARALTNGTPFEREYRLRGEDGAFRWFLTRATPVRDHNGQIVKWYGSNTDIDEARRAARTMRVFADIGEALSESLELQATLSAVMHIIVPDWADWAFIDLLDDAGSPRIAAIYHDDPAKSATLNSQVGRIYRRTTRSDNAGLDGGYYHAATYEDAAKIVLPDVLTVFSKVGFRSIRVVPLVVGSVVRGALVLCMSDRKRSFEALDVPFFRELARRIVPAINNAESYERERRVAQTFQKAALPANLPEVDGYRFKAIYEAGRSEALVGGDWYDAFALLDGRIVISIGDVAGSGLQAAVIMASVRQTIRGVAQVHADPELMLESADRALRTENPNSFVTAFVGVIDPVSQSMRYKSAGHPPPLLRHPDGSIEECGGVGPPLGLRMDDEGESPCIELPPGSVLTLYTDGLIESTHDIEEGCRRTYEALREDAVALSDNPAQALHDHVLLEGARDDVAILTVAIEKQRERLHWMIDASDGPAARNAKEAILTLLRERRYPEHLLPAAELILAELIANLSRYAPRDAELILEWNAGRATLHVLDTGPGFSFAAKLPKDIYSESGRGLFLIASLAHDFHVTRRTEGGSHACVVLRG
jgi:PAS domain S-box-containing protein